MEENSTAVNRILSKLQALPPIRLTLFFFIFCIVITIVLAIPIYYSDEESHKEMVTNKAIAVSHNISEQLQEIIETGEVLALYMRQDTGVSQERFNEFAKGLRNEDNQSIVVFSYSNNFKIKLSTLYNEVNSNVEDDLRLKKGRKERLAGTLPYGKIYVEGPDESVRGKMSKDLIIFVPVYSTDAESKKINYLGTIEMIVNWEQFIAPIGLDDDRAKYRFALIGINGDGEHGEVFQGDYKLFQLPDIIKVPIPLPAGEWVLGVSSHIDLIYGIEEIGYLLIVDIILSVFFYIIISLLVSKRRDNLQRDVFLGDVVTVAVFSLDIELLTFSYIGDVIQRITGYLPEELLGKPMSYGMQKNDRDKFDDMLLNAKTNILNGTETNPIVTFEVLSARQDGSNIWLQYNYKFYLENNAITAIYGYIEDMTRRKEIEMLDLHNKSRYNRIMEDSYDAYWTWDLLSGRFTSVSAGMHKLTGFRPEEMMNMHINEVFANSSVIEVMDVVNKALTEYMETGNIDALHVSVDALQRCKDNRYVWIEFTTFPAELTEGKLVEVMGVSRNIEVRKKREMMLADTAYRNNVILDYLRDTIWMAYYTTKDYAYISQSSINTLGYGQEEIVERKNMKDIYEAKTFQVLMNKFKEQVESYKQGGDIENIVMDVQLIHKDKSKIWYEVSHLILFNEQAEPQHIIGIIKEKRQNLPI